MEPTAEQLAALGTGEQEGPVVMLNLVRFREQASDGDGTGRDAYLRYSRWFIPLLKRCGGTILWAGDVTGVAIGDAGDIWDYAVLVQYPDRRAFVATITSDADDYAREVAADLKAKGLRVELDLRNEKINYKVREHSLAKVPVLAVVGRREAELRQVALRRLGSDGQEILELSAAANVLALQASPPDVAPNAASAESQPPRTVGAMEAG